MDGWITSNPVSLADEMVHLVLVYWYWCVGIGVTLVLSTEVQKEEIAKLQTKQTVAATSNNCPGRTAGGVPLPPG